MSITINPKGRFQAEVSCICMDVFTASNDLLPGHDDCQGFIVVGPRIPELNLANGNVTHLFALLEIEFDYCGEIEASDLLAKVAGARRKPLAEYARSAEALEFLGVRAVNCPLEERQLQGYLDALTEIANWAMEEEIPVQWA